MSVMFVWLLVGTSHMLLAQSPFTGIVIEEEPIPPAIAATIQAQAGFNSLPRTWRVYVCVDSPLWELQAVTGTFEGGISYPFIVDCPACTGTDKFYQHYDDVIMTSFSQFVGNNINPAFFAISNTLEYDSWFNIGQPYLQVSGLQWVPDPNLNPAIAFENGGALVENATLVGSTVAGFWSPPNPQGVMDADGRILIAQLTTDGVFTGICTFQFRRLNADLSVFLPVTVEKNYNVTFTNQPGQFVETCEQLFLPVDLMEFNVAASQDRVNILWKTASEEHADEFIVERSTDLQEWKEIGRVPAKGYSETVQEYFLPDLAPYRGINYYRLRQVDFDGEYELSDVRSAVFRSYDISLYPNPATQHVWFKGDLEGVERIRFISMRGQVVLEQWGKGEPIREMDVHSLAAGTYVVEIIYPDGMSFRNTLQVTK